MMAQVLWLCPSLTEPQQLIWNYSWQAANPEFSFRNQCVKYCFYNFCTHMDFQNQNLDSRNIYMYFHEILIQSNGPYLQHIYKISSKSVSWLPRYRPNRQDTQIYKQKNYWRIILRRWKGDKIASCCRLCHSLGIKPRPQVNRIMVTAAKNVQTDTIQILR